MAWVDELVAELAARRMAVETVFARGEPTLDHLRDGLTVARGMGADLIVSVGGGAVIDLGKAIAGLGRSDGDPVDYLELGGAPAKRAQAPLPFVAIPTTAGTGAEATKNAVIGVPERMQKISLRDPAFVADLALVDPALTDDAPRALTLATGLDAVTQLVESYLSIRANPVTDAICAATIPDAVAALRRLMEREEKGARDVMARASYLSGVALANSGLGVVHGLAAIIGGRGGAHGAICGRLLAPALAVNREVAEREDRDVTRFDRVDRWLAEGLGARDGNEGLREFVSEHGLETLDMLNCLRRDFAVVAEAALGASSTQANPVTLSQADIVSILDRAG